MAYHTFAKPEKSNSVSMILVLHLCSNCNYNLQIETTCFLEVLSFPAILLSILVSEIRLKSAVPHCQRLLWMNSIVFRSAYAPEELEIFVQKATEMRTINYGQLLGSCLNCSPIISVPRCQLSVRQVMVTKAQEGSLNMVIRHRYVKSASTIDISGSLYGAFSIPYMCGTGNLTDTGVTSATFDGGQRDAFLAMDVDEDPSNHTMGILQLQMNSLIVVKVQRATWSDKICTRSVKYWAVIWPLPHPVP